MSRARWPLAMNNIFVATTHQLRVRFYVTACVRMSLSSSNLRIVFGIARSGFDLMFVFSWVSFVTYRGLSWLSAAIGDMFWIFVVLFSTYYRLHIQSRIFTSMCLMRVGCNWWASRWLTNWSPSGDIFYTGCSKSNNTGRPILYNDFQFYSSSHT